MIDRWWRTRDSGRDVDQRRRGAQIVRRRNADHSQWSLVVLKPTREIFASRVLRIIVTLLVALMSLIYLFGKERGIHDNVQMDKRLKLQELARDLRLQATTDPLTGPFQSIEI